MENKIKLAEALSERKDLQTRLEQLEERLKANVKVQEGDKPAEKPDELLAELDRCLTRLEFLIFHINITNTQTIVDGESLTALIAKKDILTQRISIMRSALERSLTTNERYSRSEIKFVTTIDTKKIRKEVDAYSQQLRLLELKIQATNYSTDLM